MLTWMEYAKSLLVSYAPARQSMAAIFHRLETPRPLSNLASGVLSSRAEADVERARERGREAERHDVDKAKDLVMAPRRFRKKTGVVIGQRGALSAEDDVLADPPHRKLPASAIRREAEGGAETAVRLCDCNGYCDSCCPGRKEKAGQCPNPGTSTGLERGGTRRVFCQSCKCRAPGCQTQRRKTIGLYCFHHQSLAKKKQKRETWEQLSVA